MSFLPSPLKSPVAIDSGVVCAGNSVGPANVIAAPAGAACARAPRTTATATVIEVRRESADMDDLPDDGAAELQRQQVAPAVDSAQVREVERDVAVTHARGAPGDDVSAARQSPPGPRWRPRRAGLLDGARHLDLALPGLGHLAGDGGVAAGGAPRAGQPLRTRGATRARVATRPLCSLRTGDAQRPRRRRHHRGALRRDRAAWTGGRDEAR